MDDFNFDKETLDELQKIFQQALKQKKAGLEPKLVREIVPASEWVNDIYYTGPEGAYMYRYWKDLCVEIFEEKAGKYNEVILTGGIGCLTLDTQYQTSEGLLTLSQITEKLKNTDVYVNSEEGKRKILYTSIKGEEDTIKLTFSNGFSVEGSSDHRIRVWDNGVKWKHFRDITVGDKILYCERPNGLSEKSYPDEKAYLLGYMLGDGYYTISKGKPCMGLLWGCDLNISSELYNLCEKYLGATPKQYCRKGWNYFLARKNNDALFEEFEGLGHAENKTIPSWVFSCSNQVKGQVVAGLFDSDGHFSKDSVEFISKSKNLVFGLQRLLNDLGIFSIIKPKGIYFRLKITSIYSRQILLSLCSPHIDYKREALVSLCNSEGFKNRRTVLDSLKDYLKDFSTVHPLIIPRDFDFLKHIRYGKQNVTRELLSRLNSFNPDWVHQDYNLSYLVDNNVRFVSVTQVEPTGRKLVGDIKVEGSPTYILNGIVNHNTGKTTAAIFLLIRKLYELSCYENINALFKLMPSSLITFAFITVTKNQAEMTSYGQFKSWVEHIPYFQENFPRNLKINSLIQFPENVVGIYGSNPSHVIGMNMISCLLDEANFFQADAQNSDQALANYDKVSRMYMAILNRANSRFLIGGKSNSLCILVSSNTNVTSFTEQRIKAVRQQGANARTRIVNARVWEVKPKGTYSDEFFLVFRGSELVDPMVVTDVADVNTVLMAFNFKPSDALELEQAMLELPPSLKEFFIKVPVDFRLSFESDINMALQDIAGVSIAGDDKFFSSREAYNIMAENSGYEHPFTKESFIISTGDTVEISDYLKPQWRPKDIDKPRFIHVDQSLAHDCTGFSTAYIKEWVQNASGVYLPVIAVDLKIRIKPPKPPKQISVQKIVNFIFYLRDTLGLNIAKVTYDQFQSKMAMQQLEENEFNVGYQSVDKVPSEAYYAFANLLYESRIKSYSYGPEQQELFELITFQGRRKIDHPNGGSKDVTDSIVGSIFNALESAKEESPNSSYSAEMAVTINQDDDYMSDMDLLSPTELSRLLRSNDEYISRKTEVLDFF